MSELSSEGGRLLEEFERAAMAEGGDAVFDRNTGSHREAHDALEAYIARLETLASQFTRDDADLIRQYADNYASRLTGACQRLNAIADHIEALLPPRDAAQ